MRDITFNYTNEEMVKSLLKLVPFDETDTVLDAGSGRNKVWQRNCPAICYECEIEDGCDFFSWEKEVDWVIGNPPYHIGWKFTEHSFRLAHKGVALLGSLNFLNQFTPKRLSFLKTKGFELQVLHIVIDKRWFGRYYFLLFEKKPGILSWDRKSY